MYIYKFLRQNGVELGIIPVAPEGGRRSMLRDVSGDRQPALT